MSNQNERDLACLQGAWEQVALEVDGVTNPADALTTPGALTTFSGQQFAVRTLEGTLVLAGTFTLDATTTPKSITWTDSIGEDMNRPLPAIYKLDADDFVFIAGGAGGPRPTAFHTTRGQTLRAFVRRR